MPASATLPKADPSAAELDSEWQKAMEGPSMPREPGPPPEVDPDAPHGRDENGQPLAPHGYRNDGKPRLTSAGRKSKDEQARTAPAGKQDAAAGAIQVHSNSWYTEKLTEFGTQMWLLIGFVSPADAGALDQNLQPMAEAWAKAAEADATVRRAVNYLCQEMWISGVIATAIPFAAMVMGNHGKLPEKMISKEKQAKQRADLEAMTLRKRELVFAQMAGDTGAE